MPFRSLNQWKLTSLNEGSRLPIFHTEKDKKTSDAIPLL